MNEEQLKQQFMQLLIQEAQEQGAQTEEDVKAYIDSLGEEGIQQKYQQFIQMIQQQQQGGIKAALGAKLNYYNKIKGNCPDGEELIYFKKGGRICKACQGKKVQKGGELNPIQEFKKKRKQK